MIKEAILKEIESLYSFMDKIDHLHSLFMKAETFTEKQVILDLIEDLEIYI